MTEQDVHGTDDTASEHDADAPVAEIADNSVWAGFAEKPLVHEDIAEKYHADSDSADDTVSSAQDPELTNDFDEAGAGDETEGEPEPDSVPEPEMAAEPERDAEPEPEPDQVGEAQAEMIAEPSQSVDPEPESDVPADADADEEEDEDAEDSEGSDDSDNGQERRRRDEEFAKEHDPERHDVEAGSEFRQRGDWTADEAGGVMVQDSDGQLTIESESGAQDSEGQHIDSRDDSGGDEGGVGFGDGGVQESRLEDVRDGGYGVGSAAPFEDGLMPFGHSIKAWHDTMTFVRPGEAGYDGVNPDVWFLDEGFAERVGFRSAH